MNKTASLIIIAIIVLLAPLTLLLKPSEKETLTSPVAKQVEGETPTDPALEKMVESPNMEPPKMTIDQNKAYTATLTTSEGIIKVELNAKQTPITVNNFVHLANKGFYNNTVFHRIIKTFMIQGGDPQGDGTGGPGYQFDDESFEGEYKRGAIAMANSGPNTNGSQFFIIHQDASLPKNYVIFGQLIEGLEALDKIAETPVKANAFGEKSVPISSVTLQSVKIIEE